MSGMDRLTDELLEAYAAGKWKSYERDNMARARELLAHRRASQAAPAPSDALREAVPLGLVEALRSGRQADMDGVMVTVSRQACEMAADILSALSASPAQEGGE